MFPRKRGKNVHTCNLCNSKRRFTELSLKWHKVKEHDYRNCKDCKQLFVNVAAFKASGGVSTLIRLFVVVVINVLPSCEKRNSSEAHAL
jgi:hypothetical protein